LRSRTNLNKGPLGQEGRGVWRDVTAGGFGGFCEEAFNVKTFQKMDVSIGAFPAYAWVKALPRRWRSKLDKQAYEPGQGKPELEPMW